MLEGPYRDFNREFEKNSQDFSLFYWAWFGTSLGWPN